MSRRTAVVLALSLVMIAYATWKDATECLFWCGFWKGLTTPSAAQSNITVVDGDTIKVNGQSWRLKGYDTPETYYAKCDAEYQAGILAKRELEALIRKAKTVQPVADGGLDRYGRTLGRLLIDGRDVADIMVERGLARRYNGRGMRQGWCGD